MERYMPTYTTVQEVLDAIKQKEESLGEDFVLYSIEDITGKSYSSIDAKVEIALYFAVKEPSKIPLYPILMEFLYFSSEGKVDLLIQSLIKEITDINQKLERKRILKRKFTRELCPHCFEFTYSLKPLRDSGDHYVCDFCFNDIPRCEICGVPEWDYREYLAEDENGYRYFCAKHENAAIQIGAQNKAKER